MIDVSWFISGRESSFETNSPYSSVVERQSCNLKVCSSILHEGIHIFNRIHVFARSVKMTELAYTFLNSLHFVFMCWLWSVVFMCWLWSVVFMCWLWSVKMTESWSFNINCPYSSMVKRQS